MEKLIFFNQGLTTASILTKGYVYFVLTTSVLEIWEKWTQTRYCILARSTSFLKTYNRYYFKHLSLSLAKGEHRHYPPGFTIVPNCKEINLLAYQTTYLENIDIFF